MKNPYKHIELFAGCGGMSLGLDAAGFELYFANELSPMAGETFAYNILGENLSALGNENKNPSKTLWIKSQYKINDLKNRLRENPLEYRNGNYSDINVNTEFEKKLLIGSIDDLLNFLVQHKSLCKNLRKQNIDVLSGGPPCQGFSLAGKRKKDDQKNLLPLSFARFAGLMQPKVVILENVKGITSPFKTDDGIKHFAWLEVAKAFSLKGFVPVCMLLNSKYFAIPQNRPRFILYAFRKDIFDKLKTKSSNTDITKAILLNSLLFFNKVRSKRKNLNDIKPSDISLYDIESDPKFFDGKLLPKLRTSKKNFISAHYAIADISSTKKIYELDKIKSNYPVHLKKLFKLKSKITPTFLENHDERNHGFEVKARFRLYQVLNSLNGLKQDALQVISGNCKDDEVFQKVFEGFKNEALLCESSEVQVFEKPISLQSFKDYLKNIESKKHSQRAIKKNEPAPAQMTIPDDLCHYDIKQLRTFTVREMARFQSFPDWFVFQSKATTGGQQRKFEIPQYTQVGNAVPPLLACELGKTIAKLLKSIER
ncbi:MAG TPA: DNA cytosine methyltransferase [Parafilimonas sp.]|nr:DNA cytosine methyltransferase [Parafilimonas sp.]